MPASTSTNSTAYDYKVRLVSVASLSGTSTPEQVIFNTTPKITETGEVEYTSLQPVHMPGGIQTFRNTKSRTFSISARFISRTIVEATQNMIYTQILRGWRYPYFGLTKTSSTTVSSSSNQKSAASKTAKTEVVMTDAQQLQYLINRAKSAGDGSEMLGAPPDVLYLYAYSSDLNASRTAKYGVGNLNKIPVVITSLNITWPDDVDYLPTYSNDDPKKSDPFPKRIDVDISLLEQHSPVEFEQFDLMKYKLGKLSNF